MKKILAIVLLLVGLVTADNYPRFSIFYEQHHNPSGHSVEAWHDSLTGQEIVCIYGGLDVPSCYLTGRIWK